MDQQDARIIPIVSSGFEHRNLVTDDLLQHICRCLYRLFRNGLILAVGSALTWIEFDRTLTLIDRPHIHIDRPGEALKYPEARKVREGYDVVFENAGLAEALHAYRSTYRPLFDDELHLFQSVKALLHKSCEGFIS